MQWLSKFSRLSSSDRKLVLEAAIWLVVAQLAILVVPFRHLAPFLGRHMAESPEKDEPENNEIVKRVSWAVQTASRHLTWECKCLAQAIAGKAMFKRCGAQSTLCLGVAKDGEEKLKAHAWLQCGDVTVIGARGMHQFTVVSTFAEE